MVSLVTGRTDVVTTYGRFYFVKNRLESKKINTNTLMKLDLCAERKERPYRHRGGVRKSSTYF